MTTRKKQTTDYPWLEDYPQAVAWDAEIPVAPVYHLLDDSIEKYPDHIALTFFGKHTTYKELGNWVDRAAKGLEQIGISKGKKVGLLLPNCPHYVIMYYAILKIGATVVNFNPLSSVKEIREQVMDSGASVVVTLDLKDLFGKAQQLLNSTTLEHIIVGRLQDYLPFPKNILFPILKHNELYQVLTGRKIIAMSDMLENDGIIVSPDIDVQEDLALLQYTGGTTGTPKGAELTHANLYANTLQCCLWFDAIEEGKEVIMAVLPFFHCFAMTAILNLGIQKGARIVMHPRFNLDAMLKDVHAEKVTVLPAVPTIFSAMLHSRATEKYHSKTLKLCVSGGAPLPKEVKTAFEQLTQCPLVEGYGLTESSPVITVNPFNNKTKPVLGSAGMPLPATIITIRDIDDTQKEMPLGEIGEICVSGPQVMKGYYNNVEETKLVLQHGVLRTGDLGYLDKHGYLFIVDRLKEMIISNGYNVYPRNVEEALYQHPAIEEAAVIGEKDEHRGEIVVAYVKLKPDQQATKENLKTFLKNLLSAYEMPREIHFVESLPKTLIGKISKKDLKQQQIP